MIPNEYITVHTLKCIEQRAQHIFCEHRRLVNDYSPITANLLTLAQVIAAISGIVPASTVQELIPFRFDYTAISLANRSGLPLSRE